MEGCAGGSILVVVAMQALEIQSSIQKEALSHDHLQDVLKGVVPPLGRGHSHVTRSPYIRGLGSIDLELMKRKSFPQIKDALPCSYFLATVEGFELKSIMICTLILLL
jgi:hypothetical protein